MTDTQTQLPIDTWIPASWDEYLHAIANPAHTTAKGYYYHGCMRLEMLPVGHDHAADDSTIALAINLFCIVQGISMKGLSNCSYRKAGWQECQPDVSYYFNDRARSIPHGTAIVNLDRFPPPDLVIEVAATTLLDDRGNKRALYEDLGVGEYWVLDVNGVEVFAYTIVDQGSQRIQESKVLPGLSIALVEAALRRSRETDQAEVGAWLLHQFQPRSGAKPFDS
ncbi:MAG: Uma2 family endonuclease [Leptolyngbyaceae cyanobacterium SL_7_1]|nr:Uma2 family endonuclease [Leptolyngbyaceae cyanobacterium SL_7_1]